MLQVLFTVINVCSVHEGMSYKSDLHFTYYVILVVTETA